jgi:dethiobiotin synthetase
VIVLVAGTGTEVGKTWVAAATARLLRARGIVVAARKPVLSHDPLDEVTDADVLAAVTGEPVEQVCPGHRRFPVAMAPPMAAEVLGRPAFPIADLVAEARVPDEGVVFVESAGGVRSPLADDGDTVTLAGALEPAIVVLVADAGLGTINAVRLAVDALAGYRVVVYLNRLDERDDLHVRNRDWLRTREGLEIVTDPEALADVVSALATR